MNLKHYSPALRTVIPERLIGYGRRQHAVHRDIILSVDQSGSIVYAGLFAAVLASIRTLRPWSCSTPRSSI